MNIVGAKKIEFVQADNSPVISESANDSARQMPPSNNGNNINQAV